MVKQTDLMSEKHVQASSEGLTQPLTVFFAANMPQATNVEVTDIDLPPDDSGFSAENYFVTLAWIEGGAPKQSKLIGSNSTLVTAANQ